MCLSIFLSNTLYYNNYLIISNLHYKKLDLNNSFQTLNIPTSANNIKNKIENFIQSLKFYFHDIAIDNEKLTWGKNANECV